MANPPGDRRPECASSAGANARNLLAMELLCDADLEATGTFRGRWSRRPEYRLARDLSFGEPRITVPAGFIVDGYSLPGRLISGVWQPQEKRWFTASTLHDWAYETMIFGADEKGRAQADNLLMRAMTFCGVEPWKRWIVWAAVRVGGWRGYGKIAPQNHALVAPLRPDLAGVLTNAGE